MLEVQRVVCTGSSYGNNFTLGIFGQLSLPIAGSAGAADIQAAIEYPTSVGNVSVTFPNAHYDGIATACSTRTNTTGGGFLVTFLTEYGDLPTMASSRHRHNFTITVTEAQKGTNVRAVQRPQFRVISRLSFHVVVVFCFFLWHCSVSLTVFPVLPGELGVRRARHGHLRPVHRAVQVRQQTHVQQRHGCRQRRRGRLRLLRSQPAVSYQHQQCVNRWSEVMPTAQHVAICSCCRRAVVRLVVCTFVWLTWYTSVTGW